MASFWFLLVVLNVLSFINSPLLSLASDHQNSETSSIISASPALLANPPQSTPSPYQQLSPDITPLFPSPGGVVPAPTGSSMPTIPANPSPPNPDEFLAPGPDSAFSPLPAYSVAPISSVGQFNLAVFLIVVTYWSIHHLLRI